MSSDTPSKKSAIEAVGSKSVTAYSGDVLSFQVKSASQPTFDTSDSSPRLYAARTPAGHWAASWVPTSAGDFTVTASNEDGDHVVFTITAKEK